MKYTFKIKEHVSYIQYGTVTVEAESLDEAKFLVRNGEYEHQGDNNIDLNTEQVHSTIIEENLTEDEKV